MRVVSPLLPAASLVLHRAFSWPLAPSFSSAPRLALPPRPLLLSLLVPPVLLPLLLLPLLLPIRFFLFVFYLSLSMRASCLGSTQGLCRIHLWLFRFYIGSI